MYRIGCKIGVSLYCMLCDDGWSNFVWAFDVGDECYCQVASAGPEGKVSK